MKIFILNKENNSKKLFIGVSILFCTIILIIGGAIAYFTQSDSEITGDIVTVDKVELEYYDSFDENNKFMRQELIPASYDNIIKAYTRVDTENKCLDGYGYSACSVYRFSIKNISDISQKLQMTLNPTANSFTNLKFLLYEITENKNVSLMNINGLKKDSNVAIPLYEPYTLKPNENKTFELIFYIESKDYDQTSEDAGKTFGAGIRVDSLTTGSYVAKNFGTSCWAYDNVTLTAFNGMDVDGKPKEECSGYVTQDGNDYYTINVPSSVGGQPITTLGDLLFFSLDFQTMQYNALSKVKEYNIEEGITTIKDGNIVNIPGVGDVGIGTFISAGYDYLSQKEFVEGGVKINLPSTLTKIGNYAFSYSNIKNINIPSNVDIVGTGAFEGTQLISINIPTSVQTIGNNAFMNNINLTTLAFEKGSNLETIGENAFYSNNISSLTIPASVQTIGNNAFMNNINLTTLAFEEGSNLETIGENAFYSNNISSLTIPASVTTIGSGAFHQSNISTLTFEEGSNLTTIYNMAFSSNNISNVVIPASVTTIERSAFSSSNISTLTFEEGSNLETIGPYAFSSNNISNITIPTSVTTIGDSAFSSNNIQTLTIPVSVTSIGVNAFMDNINLTTLTFEEGSNLMSIGSSAFGNCNLTYTDPLSPLVIPNGVTEIGSYAFSNKNGTGTNPYNRYLKYIEFKGSLTAGNTDWYDSGNTTLNP